MNITRCPNSQSLLDHLRPTSFHILYFIIKLSVITFHQLLSVNYFSLATVHQLLFIYYLDIKSIWISNLVGYTTRLDSKPWCEIQPPVWNPTTLWCEFLTLVRPLPMVGSQIWSTFPTFYFKTSETNGVSELSGCSYDSQMFVMDGLTGYLTDCRPACSYVWAGNYHGFLLCIVCVG